MRFPSNLCCIQRSVPASSVGHTACLSRDRGRPKVKTSRGGQDGWQRKETGEPGPSQRVERAARRRGAGSADAGRRGGQRTGGRARRRRQGTGRGNGKRWL